MKSLVLFLPVCCVAALLAAPLFGQGAPEFQPGKYLLTNGSPILPTNRVTAPAVCDWNADQAKDLLVGTFYKGNVYLFLNVGTDNDPVFAGGTMLEADGKPISVGYG